MLAAELPADIGHLHAHFLHTPASVARYAALISGLDWTVSAHAKDIWTTPDWETREKLGEVQWAVTCTAAGCAHLAALAPRPERVALCYHGLDFERFAPPPVPRPDRDGSDADRPVVLLSVGRAVPKKGYDDLLVALALLPPELTWRFVHIGGGRARRGVAAAGRNAWLVAADRVARRARAARCALRLSRGRPVRARRQGHRRRRPRRPPQRAVGGSEPTPRLHRNRHFRHPGADRDRDDRAVGPAGGSAGARPCPGRADRRPGAARSARRCRRAPGARAFFDDVRDRFARATLRAGVEPSTATNAPPRASWSRRVSRQSLCASPFTHR